MITLEMNNGWYIVDCEKKLQLMITSGLFNHAHKVDSQVDIPINIDEIYPVIRPGHRVDELTPLLKDATQQVATIPKTAQMDNDADWKNATQPLQRYFTILFDNSLCSMQRATEIIAHRRPLLIPALSRPVEYFYCFGNGATTIRGALNEEKSMPRLAAFAYATLSLFRHDLQRHSPALNTLTELVSEQITRNTLAPSLLKPTTMIDILYALIMFDMERYDEFNVAYWQHCGNRVCRVGLVGGDAG